MKKILVYVISIFVIVGGTFCITHNFLNNKEKNDRVINNIEDNIKVEDENVENSAVINNNTENEVVETINDEVPITNNKKEEKKEKVKETTKHTPKVDKVESTKKETTESKTESVVEEIKPIEKHKCTNNDSEYIKWLNEFKSNNDTSRIFYSKEDAINYGENVALENGYGYFYNKSAISYENDYCKMDIYTVRLYIPAKTCEDNKMMYLKANEEVIHSFSYLKKLGYECKDKVIS